MGIWHPGGPVSGIPDSELLVKCHQCDQPSTNSLMGYGYCDEHFNAVVIPLRAKWGQPYQTDQMATAPGNEHLAIWACFRCEVTWAAPVGAQDIYCQWCHERWVRHREWTRSDLLKPPWLMVGWDGQQVNETDWAERLAEAVGAGFITFQEGGDALQRWDDIKHGKSTKPR